VQEDTKTLSQATGELVDLCLLLAVCMAWRGYVVTKLWAWFIVTHFGAAPLGLTTAIGLSILAGMFSVSTARSKDQKEDDITATRVVLALAFPAMGLLFGWIVASIGA
jgi:hypothetical protein